MRYSKCLNITSAVIIEYRFDVPSELVTEAALVQRSAVPAVFQHTCNHDPDCF
jgi:hypothetical protein